MLKEKEKQMNIPEGLPSTAYSLIHTAVTQGVTSTVLEEARPPLLLTRNGSCIVGSMAESERGRESIPLLISPQMPATARTGPKLIQEPGILSSFPTWVLGTPMLES